MLLSPMAGIFAMILANPFQILWDLMCVYLNEIKIDKENPKRSCALLSYQLFMAFLFTLILFYSMHLAIIVAENGDSFLVFVTFIVMWIIDQVKQFGTLALIYLIVVRRFGYLKVNEKEFVNPEDVELKKEMAIPRL